MKVGIDIQCTLGKLTGIPRYTLNLIRALKELDPSFELIPLRSALERELKTYERLWWEACELPRQIACSQVDLFHAPGFGVRKTHKTRVVITAHDLIGYLFPGHLSWTARAYWSGWLSRCYRKADHLIADSWNTQRDLTRYLGIPEKKISVVYLAPDLGWKRMDKQDARIRVQESLGIDEPFFLFVGTIEPRKNLIGTLRAYALALKQMKDLPKLMIVGAKAWGTPAFTRAVARLSLGSRIITTGFVPDDFLWVLYHAAHAVVFVSLYEGFGLPLVEAFQCGTPVITSANSSLKEIGGDAAYFVDPRSDQEIAQAMLELARDGALARRLGELGLGRAAEFSWAKTARATMDVYRKICG